MELELEGRAVLEVVEGLPVEGAVGLVLLVRVQGVGAGVELRALVGVREHLLGGRDVDELLLRQLLLRTLEVVRVPLLRRAPVRLHDLLLAGRPEGREGPLLMSSINSRKSSSLIYLSCIYPICYIDEWTYID